MAKVYATPWHRFKFLLSGLLLILPVWFLYQSLTPEFPDALEEKAVGDYVITPMPYELGPAYLHDGVYVKDFLLTFSSGNIENIRQGVLNIGEAPLSINEVHNLTGEEGFVHGSRHGLHVHGLAKPQFNAQDSIWLTLENWDGEVLTANWPLPVGLK
ncbi:hypothetical protein [Bermanella sp. R86510]|uniref:hypothetical protein n=1 Tax=unclassified Bermanella TaxID=2627862 RepID=UPI0037C8DF45